MTEHPLLFFPTPEKATRSKQGGGAGSFHKPTPKRQGERLAPKFKQLRSSFTAGNAKIQETVTGVDPEQVLVFETIGSVEDFANAVKKIEGFEWLGEIELEEITPDSDFYDEKDKSKMLNGRLYLILSNLRAFDELLSLWTRYQNDPSMTWDHGFTKYRDVFLNLKDIRRWGIQERLYETGVTEFWWEELEHQGNQQIPFEVELWYRKDEKSREKSIERISTLIVNNGGNIRSVSMIGAIHYIGILAELPANAIQSILDHSDVKLVASDEIMFFRAVGQMAVGRHPAEGDIENSRFVDAPLPQGDPTVAVLDGLPLANHRFLAGRLLVDDPDNWEADYLAGDRKHGTAMASLVVHGDLNEPSSPLARPIYIRPIFKPIPQWTTLSPSGQSLDDKVEGVPKDCLLVDLIHQAVKRLFEGESGAAPVAPHVKIVNLSLGDRARPFFQFNSPLARLLDWLSTKYNILFVVSAGNYPESIVFDISERELKNMVPADREAKTIKTLYQDFRNRRLLSPAESINSLTVGALHFDASTVEQYGHRIDLLDQPLPSPISAFGSGYRKSVKPDLIFNGGKQLYTPAVTVQDDQSVMELRRHLSPPGIKVTCPGKTPGELEATSHSCGTSNATALISRAAGLCYDSLLEIINENEVRVETGQEVSLLKAMLVHGCEWGDIAERIDGILRNPDYLSEQKGYFKNHISRWMGYGIPTVSRVLTCTEQRATLLGYGKLNDEEADVYQFPLPPILSGKKVYRRLTVTLAWLSPVSASTQKYRTAGLWFDLNKDDIAVNRKEIDWQMAKRGTVQHEIFEGERAAPYSEDEVLKIKVNCKKDAGSIVSPVAYGLVVSLEVGEGTALPIYEEVRTRIRKIIRIRPVSS